MTRVLTKNQRQNYYNLNANTYIIHVIMIYNYHYLIGWTSNEKRAQTFSFFRQVLLIRRDTHVHRNVYYKHNSIKVTSNTTNYIKFTYNIALE